MITIKRFSKHIKKVQNSDRDSVVGITGWTGEGKSNFGVALSIEADNKFDMTRNVIYSRNELNDKILNFPEYSALDVDEAINVLFKRDFMKGDQRSLIKVMNMCRDRHHLLVLTLPSLFSLDSEIISTGRIRYWVHIDIRGHAYLFQPDDSPFTKDPWHRSTNDKLWKRNDIEKSPNFVDEIVFEKLNNEIENEYKKVKIEKRKEAKADEEEERFTKLQVNQIAEKIRKNTIVEFFMTIKDQYLKRGTRKDIARIMNINTSTLKRYLVEKKKKLDNKPIVFDIEKNKDEKINEVNVININ